MIVRPLGVNHLVRARRGAVDQIDADRQRRAQGGLDDGAVHSDRPHHGAEDELVGFRLLRRRLFEVIPLGDHAQAVLLESKENTPRVFGIMRFGIGQEHVHSDGAVRSHRHAGAELIDGERSFPGDFLFPLHARQHGFERLIGRQGHGLVDHQTGIFAGAPS